MTETTGVRWQGGHLKRGEGNLLIHSALIIHRFHVCEFTYTPKFTCVPKSNVFGTSQSFGVSTEWQSLCHQGACPQRRLIKIMLTLSSQLSSSTQVCSSWSIQCHGFFTFIFFFLCGEEVISLMKIAPTIVFPSTGWL